MWGVLKLFFVFTASNGMMIEMTCKMGDGCEIVINHVCPLCGELYNIMTKRAGYVIDFRSDLRRMTRVCFDCDAIYDALEKLRW